MRPSQDADRQELLRHLQDLGQLLHQRQGPPPHLRQQGEHRRLQGVKLPRQGAEGGLRVQGRVRPGKLTAIELKAIVARHFARQNTAPSHIFFKKRQNMLVPSGAILFSLFIFPGTFSPGTFLPTFRTPLSAARTRRTPATPPPNRPTRQSATAESTSLAGRTRETLDSRAGTALGVGRETQIC